MPKKKQKSNLKNPQPKKLGVSKLDKDGLGLKKFFDKKQTKDFLKKNKGRAKYNKTVKDLLTIKYFTTKDKKQIYKETKNEVSKKEFSIIYKFDKKGKRFFIDNKTGKRTSKKLTQKIILQSITAKTIEKTRQKHKNILTLKQAEKKLKQLRKKKKLMEIIKSYYY